MMDRVCADCGQRGDDVTAYTVVCGVTRWYCGWRTACSQRRLDAKLNDAIVLASNDR